MGGTKLFEQSLQMLPLSRGGCCQHAVVSCNIQCNNIWPACSQEPQQLISTVFCVQKVSQGATKEKSDLTRNYNYSFTTPKA